MQDFRLDFVIYRKASEKQPPQGFLSCCSTAIMLHVHLKPVGKQAGYCYGKAVTWNWE